MLTNYSNVVLPETSIVIVSSVDRANDIAVWACKIKNFIDEDRWTILTDTIQYRWRRRRGSLRRIEAC